MKKKSRSKVRYAVVGLGSIAQKAVLPAFKNAKNAELYALVSGDPLKLKRLGKQYDVGRLCNYEEYEALLKSGEIDAIYLALPNHLHKSFTVRAAEQGVHVLCEKPMALTTAECEEMIQAAEQNKVKLMIAYRLHFEKSNLRAIELGRTGRLGELRLFNSVFSYEVREGDIRTSRAEGGGPTYDIGVYCINAARYLFQDEPIEVYATVANTGDPRFHGVEETVSAVLRFPQERLANFSVSFDSSATDHYQLVGTKGDLFAKNAYQYDEPIGQLLTIGDKSKKMTYPVSDQFGAEIAYFSDCVLKNKEPEPSGWEGLADLRVIEAIFQSIAERRPVILPSFIRRRRPTLAQRIWKPRIRAPRLIHARPPVKKTAA